MTDGLGTAPRDGVIESASATTDPENANSGPFAYVFTAIVLVGSIALATTFGAGLAGAVAEAAPTYRTETRGRSYDYLDDDYYDDYFDDLDELEDLLREYQR